MNSIYYNCWLFYLTTFLIVLKGLERLANEEADTPLPRENFAPAPTFLKDFSAVTFPIFTPCLDAIKIHEIKNFSKKAMEMNVTYQKEKQFLIYQK